MTLERSTQVIDGKETVAPPPAPPRSGGGQKRSRPIIGELERQGPNWPMIGVFLGGIAIGLIVGAGGAILILLHLITL